MSNQKLGIGDLFSFNRYITPKVIKILFYLAIIFILFTGFGLASGVYYSWAISSNGFFAFLIALVVWILYCLFSIIVTKVGFELVMSIFNIRANIEEINLRSKNQINQ